MAVALAACSTPRTDYASLSAALLNAPAANVVGPAGFRPSPAQRQLELAGAIGLKMHTGAILGRTGRVKPRVERPKRYLQCVPFARDLSGVQIRGDAYTWWDQARGRYDRSTRPRIGAVLVLKGYRTQRRGHVAVVTRIIDSRTIVVDHANWLNDGQIYIDTPVRDVSKANDWSEVRVWYVPGRKYGSRTYGVKGFILPATDVRLADGRVARASHRAPIDDPEVTRRQDPAALPAGTPRVVRVKNAPLPRAKPAALTP